MAVKQAALKGDGVRDFSGGPNLRDAAPELAANEGSDAWNVTFDERGGVSSRLGMAKYNGSVYGGGLVQNIYVSAVAAAPITQAGASLYKGTSTTANKTFTTSARVGMVDFTLAVGTPVLCVIHPVDGLFTSVDGVTFVAVADADAPKGDVLEVWLNKLYAAGNPTNPSRVSWSAAGAADTWAATDFNDVRSKDNTKVVALKIASGLDIAGRAGLLAFKNESAYRIYDSATGAYEVIDGTIGAASALSVVGVGAKVIVLNKHGIYWWANGQVGFQNASDRLQPLWDPSQVNLAQLALWCAGRKGNRARFSLTRAGSTANDLTIEYHPEQGWLAPGSNATSCYATSFGAEETFYGGSPTVSGQSYTLDTTGADDGTAIAWRFQTRWFELNAGFRSSLWQLRLHGRGAGSLTVLRDYVSAGGDIRAFNLTAVGNRWDTGLHWDAFYYAIPAYQQTQALFSIGLCRQFSLKFSGSSTTTDTGRQLLGAGTTTTVGYFGLFGVEWLYEPLGLS